MAQQIGEGQDKPSSNEIVAVYLALLVTIDRRYSVWKERLLPFSKDVIKPAILGELRPLKDGTSSRRRQLVHAYVALACFIAPDDAQFLVQSEKMTWKIGDQIRRGETVTREDYELLGLYEKPSMKLHARIDREERELIADIAALNAGFVIEKTVTGYVLRTDPHSAKTSGTQRKAAAPKDDRPSWMKRMLRGSGLGRLFLQTHI